MKPKLFCLVLALLLLTAPSGCTTLDAAGPGTAEPAPAAPSAGAKVIGTELNNWEEIRDTFATVLNAHANINKGYYLVPVEGALVDAGTAFIPPGNEPRMPCTFAAGELRSLGFARIPDVQWTRGFNVNLTLPKKWATAIGFTAAAGLNISNTVTAGFDDLTCKIVDYPTLQRRFDTGDCRKDLLYGVTANKMYVLVGYVYGKQKIILGQNVDGNANVTKLKTTDKAIDVTYVNNKGLKLESAAPEPLFAIFTVVTVTIDPVAATMAANAATEADSKKQAATTAVAEVKAVADKLAAAPTPDLQTQFDAVVNKGRAALNASKVADANAAQAEDARVAKTTAKVADSGPKSGDVTSMAAIATKISAKEEMVPISAH